MYYYAAMLSFFQALDNLVATRLAPHSPTLRFLFAQLTHLAGIYFIGAFLFFLLSLGVAGAFFYFGGNSVSVDKIDIDIQGPTTIAGGDIVPLSITVTNRHPTTVDNATIEINFPEGTRSPDGKLGPFKRGVANIILKSGRRVVPTAIIGSREFLPRESWLCHPEHRDITIRFGRPIGFHHLDKVPREESLIVLEELRQEVKKLLGEEVGAIHELPLQSDDKKAVVPQVRHGESARGMTSREEARG